MKQYALLLATAVTVASFIPSNSSAEAVRVEIEGNDQMKFNVTEIVAKAGQEVIVTMKNVGTMPKVSMGHNFVVLKNDIEPDKFVEASMMHMGNEYIAPDLKGHVIASTKLLGPGESDTVTFTAPAEPGEYVFLCTFPGHYAIGMKGVLKVE